MPWSKNRRGYYGTKCKVGVGGAMDEQQNHGQGQGPQSISSLSSDITVVDVYDIASDIGKECEKIIDQYGADAVTSLMPKVIGALELLETLATRNERENTQLAELTAKISQLENEKLEKAEYRQKFEKDLEMIEEQWRTETKDLVSMVSKLQEENRRLMKEYSPNHQPTKVTSSDVTPDVSVLQRLKASLEKQRDEIRIKDKLILDKSLDIDNLKSQVERLTVVSRDLRRKHRTLQNQVRTFCDERADFLVQMQDQQRDINKLRSRLGLAQKENEDLSKCDVGLPSNKVVFDLDDPKRPRFTFQELKDILHERNELKARVSDLEDELETYRPKSRTDFKRKASLKRVDNACGNVLDVSKKSSTELEIHRPQPGEEDDAPVQGPLPYEPDDAPWKKASESGIRKFFRKIFSENSSAGSFPKRSLSTLSKMALSSTSEPLPV